MANDHSIELLITANLNIGASIGNINSAIKTLSKHPSLKTLDLKVDVDKSFVKSMDSFVQATKKLSTALEAQKKVVHEEIETFKRLDGTIEKVTKQRLENGDIITKSNKRVDESKKKIQEETDAYNKQKKTLQDLEAELVGYSRTKMKENKNKAGAISSVSNTYQNSKGGTVTVNTDPDGYVRNYNKVMDYAKAQKQALDYEKMVNAEREQVHRETLRTRQAITDAETKATAKKVANDKLHNSALQENERLEQQYAKTVMDSAARINASRTSYAKNDGLVAGLNQLESKLNGVSGSFGSRNKSVQSINTEIKEYQEYAKAITDVTNKLERARNNSKNGSKLNTDIKGLQDQLKGLAGSTRDRINTISGINEQFKSISSSAKDAKKGISFFGDGLIGAMANMAKFQLAMSAMYAPLTALKSIFSTVINVDAQETQLRRVMDEHSDFATIVQRNIDIANEFGRSIQDVNENAIGFARMGFDSAQTDELTKVSTLAQNISDLTPKESVDTLTAAMTVFNVEASKSIGIVDALNEVDNNFGASRSVITA
ncbi:phage tail tape measure protein [Saccharibacillus deserti]|uniref:phage tail tape measure protein n=1 Tax=Saccharibacillus deserti TaxID=1634444 RepID=UPI001557D233|nr:phage tail tape measure protein [Saccharibacillus deserti]